MIALVALLAWHIIGQGIASGKLTIAAASGTAIRPAAIELKIHAKPSVRTVASYSIRCRKGSRKRNGAGKARGRTPFTKAVPLPMAHPDICLVAASATLASKATLTGPLKVRALELNSVLGSVGVVNADNHADGEGAVFDFTAQLDGNTLAPDAFTRSRTLVFRFPNMSAKPFFVGKEFESEWLTLHAQVLAGAVQEPAGESEGKK